MKIRIKKRLDISHSERCAYCGNSLYVTSGLEIEHVAPKGTSLYPQFMFTPHNLVAACSLCNGCHKKHSTDIIDVVNVNYSLCTFKIVHPYFDDPSIHIGWTNNERVFIEDITPKGLFTINLFELNSPNLTLQRAKDLLHHTMIVEQNQLTQAQLDLINKATFYK